MNDFENEFENDFENGLARIDRKSKIHLLKMSDHGVTLVCKPATAVDRLMPVRDATAPTCGICVGVLARE